MIFIGYKTKPGLSSCNIALSFLELLPKNTEGKKKKEKVKVSLIKKEEYPEGPYCYFLQL